MRVIKSFILGAATAYGIHYITKKRAGEKSIVNDFMDNPHKYINQAKDYAISEITGKMKSKFS